MAQYNPIHDLVYWFNGLDPRDKVSVLDFLYSDLVYTDGSYLGPDPDKIKTGGLHCGPAPTMQIARCPRCGRAY